MKQLGAIIAGSLILAGCVSTEMRALVGQPIQEAQIRYGPPVQVVDMPDGGRAYGFHYGGGAAVLPSSSRTTAFVNGPVISAQTQTMPGGVVELPGCTITFMARQHGPAWVIEDIRVPKQLVC